MRIRTLAAALVVMACGPPRPLPFGVPRNGECGIGGFGGTFQPVVIGTNVEIAVSLGRAAVCPEGGFLSALGTLSVVDSSGTAIAARLEPRGGSASAVFTPPRADSYVVNVTWNGPDGNQPPISVIVVDERSTAFVTTTFTDRMDNCADGPFRTRQGLTLCGRELANGPLISVYGADGSFLESFPGTNLVVRGDSVWTRHTDNADLVDLRVASGTALANIGSAELGFGGVTTEFETSGLRSTGAGYEFSTARLQGVDLVVTHEPTLWPDAAGFEGVVHHDLGQWWENSCHVIPGCASMPLVCAPVRQCLIPSFATTMSVEPDAAWFFSGNVLMLPRPFDASATPEATNGVFFIPGTPRFPRNSIQQGAQAPVIQVAEGVLLAQRMGQTFRFDFVRATGQVMSATRDFVVTLPDPANPFVVRFDRVPPQ